MTTLLARAIVGWGLGMVVALVVATLFPLGFLAGVVIGATFSYGGAAIGMATTR